MVLKRFYDDGLAQASYLIGCPAAGECLIVDPNRDFGVYLDAAEAEYMRIAAVTETHIHADYLSGARELARITGARLYLSAEGGKDWQYGFADEATLLRDGDTIRIGGVEATAKHTPGHTPEHLTFLVRDTAATDVPMGALTGDFVFVGDVGRPDLLERAANIEGTMEAGARDLYRSIQALGNLLPDYAMLFPGHGAGSACGKSLGAVPVTTLGYERQANWALRAQSEQEFVDEVLRGQPDPPAYFATMKRMNKEGPALLGDVAPLPEFDAEGLPQAASDTLVLDVRTPEAFAAGHVPKSLHIPTISRRFSTYAGMVLPYDMPITLVAGGRDQAEAARLRLRLIGLDDVRGWLPPPADGFATLDLVDAADAVAAAEEGQATLLDVRSDSAYRERHAKGAQSLPLSRLLDRAGELERDKPVALYCESGIQSVVAASVLQRLGFPCVAGVRGGASTFAEAGIPVVEGSDG